MLERMNAHGVAFSTGSACRGSNKHGSNKHGSNKHDSNKSANPVLAAIGMSDGQAREVMRFSFSRFNTDAEIDRVAELLERETKFLLSVAPKRTQKQGAASRVAAKKVKKR